VTIVLCRAYIPACILDLVCRQMHGFEFFDDMFVSTESVIDAVWRRHYDVDYYKHKKLVYASNGSEKLTIYLCESIDLLFEWNLVAQPLQSLVQRCRSTFTVQISPNHQLDSHI